MVDSTPFQPIFPPGAFALFPPARAKEGPAPSLASSASASREGPCNDATSGGSRAASLAA